MVYMLDPVLVVNTFSIPIIKANRLWCVYSIVVINALKTNVTNRMRKLLTFKNSEDAIYNTIWETGSSRLLDDFSEALELGSKLGIRSEREIE
ncbi:hypothetical protein N9B67_00540 [Algibacter sp.]|nr:hypothetical protein [Algibacter sp.]MDC1276970.1 hypothetical protein [Algibacter sp.]